MRIIDQRIVFTNQNITCDAERNGSVIDPVVLRRKAVSFHAPIIVGDEAWAAFHHAQMFHSKSICCFGGGWGVGDDCFPPRATVVFSIVQKSSGGAFSKSCTCSSVESQRTKSS